MMADRELEPLTKSELQSFVRSEIDDAVEFNQSELEQDRIDGQLYFNGGTKIKHEEGRSAVIVTKVRDTIRQLLPSVVRTFIQSGKAVEIKPTHSGDYQMALAQNDVCNKIFWNNGGYNLMISCFTDAFNKRVGIGRVTYDVETVLAFSTKESLNRGEIRKLEDEGYEVTELTPLHDEEEYDTVEESEYEETETEIDKVAKTIVDYGDEEEDEVPDELEEDENQIFDVVYTKKVKRGVWKLTPIPPEEFIIDKNATSIQDSRVCGIQCNKTVSDLIDMGINYEDIIDADRGEEDSSEKQARQVHTRNEEEPEGSNIDESSRDVLTTDILVRVDADGDGYAELRHFICLGTQHKIVVDEPFHFKNYAPFRTDVEPHSFFPRSINEFMRQDQDAQTALLRSILDNAGYVNNPRTVVNNRYVNIADVLNNEYGTVIRSSDVEQIKELVVPFIGKESLPVLQYLNEMSDKRAGTINSFQGSDPDALQSISRQGVDALIKGGQALIDMVSRNLAEGMAEIFAIIIKTIIHSDMKEIEIPNQTGQFSKYGVELWHSHVEYRINIGIGTMRPEEKMPVLMQMAAKQEQIIMQLGFDNPLCTWNNLRDTYVEVLRLGGYDNASTFFPQLSNDQLKKFGDAMRKSQAESNKDQGVEGLIAVEKYKADQKYKSEQFKLHADTRIKQLENQFSQGNKKVERALEAWKTILQDDRERDFKAMDFALDEFELENKFEAEMNKNELNAEVNRDRNVNGPE